MLELLSNLMIGDAMDGLVKTGNSIIQWAQRGAMVGAAIAFCIGGYFLIFGGDRGRSKCIGWFIGGAVGLVIVMGCSVLAESVNSNVKFGQILWLNFLMK
ncbi:hypothetical protein [Bacillus cereus group sp. BfR-BA-01329]|uniref:hypothetical protein n=1 Tax=Bacillus cereus group sp. BfR-BA-01329 TaxID=2920305 RepID=UPI001F56EC67|nr:hypothetical protein [Bacillus cereus group sp. BfR-BA-01329]